MGKIAWKILGAGGGALAALAARKALTLVWEKSMDKPVPVNPGDEDTGLAEALAWTIVSGVGVAVVQLVVERYAIQTVRSRWGDQALPKKLRADANETGAV
ncbi:DUF4235 domain-containing protein [Brevibacterium sp. 5221]|uniref:DUF4235 domain-containing protein n=1 Tax=Brevibacterium rongguiense TaxID=2695267 RepID=A0A6N9H868_9MICO|nr:MULTISPECIES: DUF4235 domain-containing protein [Brevibacterium]MYM20257.1 DUF4235 domain-containing protein [Brevibacterium rongguiense]WAL39748.1 DUF4235 domain-containing protein [Brevibacterium sp. BRM-1]